MEMDKEPYDFIFKIIIIGNGSCGKTSILYHYLNGKQPKNVAQTVGVEFSSKMISIKGKSIKLQLWDTAGQERYRSIARTYYRGALGAICLFDLTNTESFQNMPQWIKDARDFARPDICIIACGNKIDLIEQRKITESQVQKLVKDYTIDSYFQTSAVTGEQIENMFQTLSEKLVQKIDNGQIEKTDLKPILLATHSSKEEAKEQTCSC
ncbi:unnamed protein product [Paramecium sonneborni]|uniref:Uncharacterized protein n=1 Tax=Paramecium sonneborni TaxID=65129 RepID=A0A8S1NCP3_9CILI|nr:unnamed protein product [Paramecium sonneborni]